MPDVDIKNPLDAENFVNTVEIIPDPAFQLKGMLLVTVNDLVVFQSPQVGFFNKYSRFSIPVTARKLSRQGHVKIFAWNGLADSSPINASGTIIISDKNIDTSSGSIASSTPIASDTIVLFPYKTYSPNSDITIGDTSANSGNFTGLLVCNKVLALEPGSFISKVSINIMTAAGNLRLKIYSDDGAGGNPGTLLSEVEVQVTNAGWFDVIISSQVQVPTSGNIWIAMETNNGACVMYDRTTGGQGFSIPHAYGPGPNPAGSGTNATYAVNLKISTYANRTKNIDLAGYKKLILMIAAASYVKPIQITGGGGTGSFTNINNIIDGDLTTYGTMNTNGIGVSCYVIVDFGNIAIRQAGVNLGAAAGGTYTTLMEVSTDGITYVPALSNPQNFRYIRFTLTNTSSVQATSLNVNEIYDALAFGGQASVSFEVYEPSSGQWIELISAASIGTISQGKAVTKQLGDTMAQSNLNNIFSSNYAGLRAKLQIITANIQTAVSYQRIP